MRVMNIKLKFLGKACHSSVLNQGINSICALAKLVTFIEEKQNKYKLTSNCGTMKGGEVINKVPDYAELCFDIRSIYSTDVKMFLKDINDFCNYLMNEYKGLKIDIVNQLTIPAFNMMDNLKINKIANWLNIKTNSFSGGCEAGYYTEYSGDAIIFGVGDLALAHKPNEFVEISEYNAYSKQLIKVMQTIENFY